jgi:hypothetical protein
MTVDPNITLLALLTDGDWTVLLDSLSKPGELPSPAAANIVESLRDAGAKSALVEEDYLDRDYSEEFSAFYSRLFERYRRRTRRLHFFRSDLLAVAEQKGFSAVTRQMQQFPDSEDYLGFVVVRPVIDAPIGRAVLATLRPPPGLGARVQVRASNETHPLGTTLKVHGMPFTQQDQRISACAQAAIWMSGRHFHTRHGGPWFSTAAITEAASKPTDFVVSSSLPAGSGGLGLNNMLRALRAMDRHPYAFAGDLTPDNRVAWPSTLPPQAILARYVGSGIPVIAGLGPWGPGQRDGHAVVVVGDTFAPLDNLALSTSLPTFAEFSPYFLVHDDQRGPHLRMPVGPGQPYAETDYNITEHLRFLIVPLPDKVFITAEAAEIKAWDRLQFYQREWPGLVSRHGHAIGLSRDLGDRVLTGFDQNRVVARTYLTMGWKYKARLHKATESIALRSRVAMHELPRMVWVTEFGMLEDLNHLDEDTRRIFGHCVTDATSTGPTKSPLIIHLPGFLWLTAHADPTFYTRPVEALIPLENDATYRARVRRLR